MSNGPDYHDIECENCEKFFGTYGSWTGDGWNDPHEFVPIDGYHCDDCAEILAGPAFKVTLSFVGVEKFDEWKRSDWEDMFDEFKAKLQGVTVVRDPAKGGPGRVAPN